MATPVVPAAPGDLGGGGAPPVEPGPAPRPDDGGSKLPWAIGAVVVLIALVAGALLATRGDDDEPDEVGLESVPVASTTTSTSTTSTSTSTSTTLAPTTAPPTTAAPTTTAAPPPTVPPEQCTEAGSDPEAPEPAAQTVFEAWTLGDEDCAAQLMTPAARVELFAVDGAGASQDFQGCFEVDEPDPAIDCAFTYEGGSTHFLLNFGDTSGWTVFDVFQVAD